MLQRYLYPVYKPKPRFKLVTLEVCTPLSHPLSTGSASGLVTALLHCPAFLAPSGVHTGRQLLMLPALLAPSAPLLPSTPLWSCPAWLHTGPPTPSGPVLPGWLLCGPPRVPRPRSKPSFDLHLITKSIPPRDNSVHSPPPQEKKKNLLSSLSDEPFFFFNFFSRSP